MAEMYLVTIGTVWRGHYCIRQNMLISKVFINPLTMEYNIQKTTIEAWVNDSNAKFLA